MKVVVSHPGRQHVHHMLYALQKKGYLLFFFTTIWNVKEKLLVRLIQRILPFTKKTFRKRFYEPLDTARIRINVFPEIMRFLLSKVVPGKANESVFIVDRLHDRHVARAIRKLDFDILLAYENCSLLSFKEAKRRNKITILDLAHVHHQMVIQVRESFPFFKEIIGDEFFFNRMNYLKSEQNKFVDYFFVLSELASDSLVNAGVPKEKIHLCNIGFDPYKFSQKKSYCHEKFTLLFVGRVSKLKGLHVLIQAFRELNLSDIELQIVGPVGDAGYLIEKLPKNCVHIPFLSQEELVHYYQNADVFVLPSFLDSWAMVVLEAMACGTPVIISENTGAKDVVKRGGGYVVQVDNVEMLKEKILFLYNNRDELKVLGDEAYHLAKNYTWENYYTQVQTALEKVYNSFSRVGRGL